MLLWLVFLSIGLFRVESRSSEDPDKTVKRQKDISGVSQTFVFGKTYIFIRKKDMVRGEENLSRAEGRSGCADIIQRFRRAGPAQLEFESPCLGRRQVEGQKRQQRVVLGYRRAFIRCEIHKMVHF